MSSAPDEAVERTPDEDSSTVQSISVLEPLVRRKSSTQISMAAHFDPFPSQRPYSQEQWYNNQTYNDSFYGQPNEYFVPSTQHYPPQQVSSMRNQGVPPAVPSIATQQYHSTPNNCNHSLYGSSYDGTSEVPFSNYLNYSVTPYWYSPAQSFSHPSAMTAASSADTNYNSDPWNSYHASLPNDLETTETPASLGQSKIMSDDKNSETSLPNACSLESKQTLEPTKRSGGVSSSCSSSEEDDFYESPVHDYRMEMLKDNIRPSKNVKRKSNNLSRYPGKLCVTIQNRAKSSTNHDKRSDRRSDGGSDGSSAGFFTTMNDQHSDIHGPRIGLSKKKCVENTPNRSDKSEDGDKYQEENLKSDDVEAKKKEAKLDGPTLREKQVQQKLARLLTSLKSLYGWERRELLIQKIELNLELNRILSSRRDNTWYGVGKKRKKNVRKDLQDVYHFLKTSCNMKERLRLKYIERELIREFCRQSKPLSLDEDNKKIKPYRTKQQPNEESIPASKRQRLSSCESSHESPTSIPECAKDKPEEASKAEPCAKNLEAPSAEKEISHEESIPTTEKKTAEDCQSSHKSPTASPKSTKKRKLKASSIKGQKNKEAKVLRKESGSEKERQNKLSQQNEEPTTKTKKKKSLEDEVIGASSAQPTTETKKKKSLEDEVIGVSNAQPTTKTKKKKKKSLEDEVIGTSSAQPTTKTKKKKSLEDEFIGASSAQRNTRHLRIPWGQNEVSCNEFYKYIGESLSALSNMKKILTNHERQLPRNIGDQLKERPSSRESFQRSNSKEDLMRQESDPLPQEQVPSNQPQLDNCEENEEYLPPRRKAVRKDLREIIEARRKKFGPRKKMVDDGKKWTSFWKRREEVEAKQTKWDALSEQVDDCVLVPPVIPEVDLLECETSEEDTTTNENSIPMKPIWAIKVESESSEDESKNVEVPTIPSSQTVPNTEDESISQANALHTEESRLLPVEMLELESLQDAEISTWLEGERNDTVESEARITTLNKHYKSTTIAVSNPEIVLPAENEFHSQIGTLSSEESGSLSAEMLKMECLQATEISSRLEEECHDAAEKEERTSALDKDHQDTTIAVSNTEILLPTEDEFHSQISILNSEERGSLSVEMWELECSLDIKVQSDLEELDDTKENEVGTTALNDEDIHSTIQVVDSGPEEDQFLSQVCEVNVEEETQSDGPVSQSSLPTICPDILVNNAQENEKSTEICHTTALDIGSASSGSNENSAANKKIGKINVKSIKLLIADDGKEYVDVQFCDENSKSKCVVKADGKCDHDGFTDDEVNLTSISHHVIPASNGCEINIDDVSKNDDGFKNIDSVHDLEIASFSRPCVQNTAADESDV